MSLILEYRNSRSSSSCTSAIAAVNSDSKAEKQAFDASYSIALTEMLFCIASSAWCFCSFVIVVMFVSIVGVAWTFSLLVRKSIPSFERLYVVSFLSRFSRGLVFVYRSCVLCFYNVSVVCSYSQISVVKMLRPSVHRVSISWLSRLSLSLRPIQ